LLLFALYRCVKTITDYLFARKGGVFMEFSGSQTIAAPIEKVWDYLLDVNKVAACAPGFQSLEELGDEHWKAVVAVGIGAVKAKFTLDVTRPEMKEPEQMTVKAHGKAPGSAVDMSGDMHLTALDDRQTQMDWKADVNVSGTIASVGARLLSGVAQKLTGQFFDCLKTKLQTSDATSSTE
jgi:carbon monoxide dehydrogenase subunit G